jgi:hypothetical protein
MSDDHKPRIYLHPDQQYISIGFTDTEDTLLDMPTGFRDHARAVEWVEAVASALSQNESST